MCLCAPCWERFYSHSNELVTTSTNYWLPIHFSTTVIVLFFFFRIFEYISHLILMNTSTNPISSAGSNLSHYSWSPTETSSCQCTLWYSARVSQQCVGDKKLHHNHNMRQYTRDFTNVFVRTLPGALTPFFSANDLATVFLVYVMVLSFSIPRATGFCRIFATLLIEFIKQKWS